MKALTITLKSLCFLFLLLLAVSCGGGEATETGPEMASTGSAATVSSPAGPESDVSGELPFEYIGADGFTEVTGCSVVLRPEDNPERIIFGFSAPEGSGEGNFDGRLRVLPFVSRDESADGTVVYTHGNGEYEAITRVPDAVRESGKVTVRRKRDGQAVTFKTLGERRGCQK